MDTEPDEHARHDGPDGSPRLSAPAYVQQPEDAERPMAARRMPDRTQNPADWDVESTEPLTPREPDDVVPDRQAAEERARRDSDAQRDEALATGTERESGYSTEIEQGAAQPRPDDA